ncbi:MurR/RpiR family transcriptional regulator [Stappia sp. BW2]|uniref:MurR/RpiR family transcriptional regulator n=1 Tax=Stappia sp. BW2 TaxID=2592622 RepID=UPI0011DEC9CD|nr:MurR/RpiR family transcriptional regulator [Stappia sp. BW2]TYC64756.1 MurR/RpiR family transcriptional regulator [Stappia sp. BW2]
MMKKDKNITFLSRVRSALPRLHPAERRLGEFVCEFPGELASYDAQELARLANVSKATVSRFVRKLDYANYDEARKHAREEQKTGSRLFLTLPSEGNPEETLTANLAQGKANLDRTFGAITQVEIDAVAHALLGARKVWVIGFRAAHPLAEYLRWQLIQVIENIVAIPGSGETLGESLASMQPEDCIIMFGLRRRVSQSDVILEQVAASGPNLLYITDEGVQLDKRPRWHFRCHTAASGPLFNHVSVMAVCHLMAMRAIELAGKKARARLRAIETKNDLLGEL